MNSFISIKGQGAIAATIRKLADRITGSLVNAEHIEGWQRGPDGRLIPPNFVQMGIQAAQLGFKVSAASDDTNNGVRVAPSVVSGVSTVAAIPEIGSTAITADPAPILDLPEDTLRWIALKLEVIPETEEIGEDSYQIKADAGLLSGDITVEAYADVAAMDADTQDPAINSLTGAVTTNGIYVLPLAIRAADGSVTQAGFYGPIGVRMCASGKLQVSSPVYAVVNP